MFTRLDYYWIGQWKYAFFFLYLDAKFGCSSFLDIQNDIDEFENASSFKSSEKVKETQKEFSILRMSYLLFGLLLNEYPDNYAFELTSRFIPLYGLKPNITDLLKQCDEHSPRHCALIVPYCQLQPPGNGLLYSMNKHTMPVVDLDFTNSQMAAISLSNKIIVINSIIFTSYIKSLLVSCCLRFCSSTSYLLII